MTAAAALPAVPAGRQNADWLVRALVLLAVIASAFNDLKQVLPVGELASDGFIYAFPLLILYVLREPGKIEFPVSLTLLTLALLATIVLGIATNYGAIAAAWFKGRTGMSRVITQGMSVTFGLVVALLFYNLARRGLVSVISRGARMAMLVMAAVGFVELGSWVSAPGLTQIHDALSAVVHANSGAAYAPRLRATAFEVSWAGVMLSFLFPFAIISLPPRNWQTPAYVSLALFLTVMSQSRTAMLVIGCQALLLAWVSMRDRVDRLVHVATVGCFAALLLLVSPGSRDFIGEKVSNMIEYGSINGREDDLGENGSNVTRLAALGAGVQMFEERPLLGVGLGQYGFNYPNYLRAEDLRSWEVRKYVTSYEDDWPPSFSLHVRLLSELGIIGYLIWALLIGPPLWRSFRAIDGATLLGRAHLAVAMTLGGWLLLGISIDSFRFFGGWIALGVGLALPAGRPGPSPAAGL